jgi:hypothetical protein
MFVVPVKHYHFRRCTGAPTTAYAHDRLLGILVVPEGFGSRKLSCADLTGGHGGNREVSGSTPSLPVVAPREDWVSGVGELVSSSRTSPLGERRRAA